MSRYVFKLPDLGEGTVSAEIVAWRVKPGDLVAEEDVIVEVLTDKAAVEVPAPVAGKVVSITGSPGDRVPVGGELIVFETDARAGSSTPATTPVAEPASATVAVEPSKTITTSVPRAARPAEPTAQVARPRQGSRGVGNGDANGVHGERPCRVATSPAIRRRAHEAGVDLTQLHGTGPHGRILRRDLESFVSSRSGSKLVPSRLCAQPAAAGIAEPLTEEIKVIGVRRLIAQRMSEAKRTIAHFAYVEELDLTELESLRSHLNGKREGRQPQLTYLPFLAIALIGVLREFPQCNAQYDAERNVIVRHRAVHLGIATHTAEGLKVPVIRNAQSLSLWELAAQIGRVTEAARTNRSAREELSGSTITVTSLGKLGGIASTPIINAPEVAIIGINRAIDRPVVHEGAITIRRMMNISSSFDHRFVDGHDAAALIQALKERIEHPATLFI